MNRRDCRGWNVAELRARCPAGRHCSGIAVKPRLDFLQHGLVLPARYAALRSSRTARFQRTALADACPVTPDRLAILYAGKTIGQPLSGGTAINILGRIIDEVLLAEARPLRQDMREFHAENSTRTRH